VGEAYRYESFAGISGEVKVYCDTVRSSSATTRKDVPWDAGGRGRREVTDEVETGMSAEVDDVSEVSRSKVNLATDKEPKMISRNCGEEGERAAMAVGGGVFAGNANLRASSDKWASYTSIADVVVNKICRSSAQAAVTGAGNSNFLKTSPRLGEKTASSPCAVVMSRTSSPSPTPCFLLLFLFPVPTDASNGIESGNGEDDQQIVVTLLAPSTSHSAIT